MAEQAHLSMSRTAARFLVAFMRHLNQAKHLSEMNPVESLETSAWVEEIEHAAKRAVEDDLINADEIRWLHDSLDHVEGIDHAHAHRLLNALAPSYENGSVER